MAYGVERIDWRAVLVMVGVLVAVPREGLGQISALVSPGRLSRPHASLEGITSCLSCHAAGRGVSAERCLSCHKPVADRMARKQGVHRNVTSDCVSCHVEHAGLDGEVRPFDQRRFNHATEAGYRLDGLHTPVAATCVSCHKGRSFLTASTTCASCHADVHKGSLGTACATCHSTSVAFKQARERFDHTRTDFPLSGAHRTTTCAACHTSSTYAPIAFRSCASCHRDPHEQKLGSTCTSCHTTQAWKSTKIDHSRTRFPLRGLHASVECESCHKTSMTVARPPAATCATCHADPHRGTFKQDCASCHTETGFTGAAFDHSTTKFSLADRHSPLACTACHKPAGLRPVPSPGRGQVPAERSGRGAATLPPPRLGRSGLTLQLALSRAPDQDFKGLETACASCHMDVHLGELGPTCEQCHTAKTFVVDTFAHAKPKPFFEGTHRPVACAQCHLPSPVVWSTAVPRAGSTGTSTARPAVTGFTRTATACASCHADIHLGQLSTQCENCHAVDVPKFAVKGFSHGQTIFQLTGKHAPLACEACHKVAFRQYPSGTGAARHLKGIGTACVSCHADRHGGQFAQGCESCHTVDTFRVAKYSHVRQRALTEFFKGAHLALECSGCHKPTGLGRPGPPVVSYKVTTTCTSCHRDVHRGALGLRCETCHRL